MGMTVSNKILSDITVYMKYARFIPMKKRRETWYEIVTRNKEMHIKKYPQLKDEIEAAYKFVYEKKVLPSMRSLQFAGKPIEISPNRIYNCAYMPVDSWEAFHETMFLLLGGTGVGYSVQKHHVKKLPEIKKVGKARRYLVGDSIEGWADAVKVLIKAYLFGDFLPRFDFSDIRQKGAQLVTSGGKAPGPQPLIDCLHNVKKVLDTVAVGEKLKPIQVHDIMCYIADAVLAGGIRRAALISLFSYDDNDMLTTKFGNWWELNPQRARANNSVVMLRHRVKKEDFLELWKKVELSKSGEPGILFSNDKEWGTNPCAEIALRPNQFCNLCEVNAGDIVDQDDFNARAKAASFIGTLQAGYTDFHYLRDVWKETTEREALIGVGITGIGSGNLDGLDLKQASKIVVEENKRVAKLIGINPAARNTTVKPSGCMDENTVIRTSKGDLSLKQIFELNGYDLDTFRQTDSTFLPVSEKLYVYDLNNELQEITNLYINGYSEMMEIEFEDGVSIKCTQNHMFLTTNRGWVRADELTTQNLEMRMKIKSIKNVGSGFSVDIEVNNTHTYQLKNSNVVHNTSSLVLGTSSGIHAWHDKFYVRRVRVGKNEAIYKHLAKKHPELVEDDYFKPHIQAVISVPQEAPKQAKFRDESALTLLERAKRFNLEWVRPGHIKGSNTHNVSVTVSIRDEEWKEVGEWMWNNKDTYNGISVLNYDNHTYVQAPFESVNLETYETLMKTLKEVDITKIVEEDDNTDLQGEQACAGASCEII